MIALPPFDGGASTSTQGSPPIAILVNSSDYLVPLPPGEKPPVAIAILDDITLKSNASGVINYRPPIMPSNIA